MTKRIDADALIKWLQEIREDEAKTMQVTEMLFQGYSRTVPYISEIALKNKVEELAENAEPDRWCYDLDKVPKDGTEILIYDGCDVFTARYELPNIGHYKPFFAKSCDGELLNEGRDWEHIPLYTDPVAWQPLPKAPEGATNVSTDI